MKLRGLEVCAGTLEELILDNNQLVRLDLRTQFPKLNTLSLNKNRVSHSLCSFCSLFRILFQMPIFCPSLQVSNLTFLLNQLTSKVPNLRYLSLLGNPVCPDQLSDERVQESEYANVRKTTFSKLLLSVLIIQTLIFYSYCLDDRLVPMPYSLSSALPTIPRPPNCFYERIEWVPEAFICTDQRESFIHSSSHERLYYFGNNPGQFGLDGKQFQRWGRWW